MNGISVIIPTYNREKFIKETIQSVLNQNYKGNLEIIISDDGSSDKTVEVANSFGNKVKILKKGKGCNSQGASSTRNRGIRIATQPYICFLDSDDFYLPNHLNRMAFILEKNPKISFAFCRTLEVKEENGQKVYRMLTQQRISEKDIKNPFLSENTIVHTNSFLIRKEIFDNIGKFNETYSTGEDRDMWMRMFEKYKGAFVDNYGSVYRMNSEENQLTKISKDKIKKNSIAIYSNAVIRNSNSELKNYYWIFELRRRLAYVKYNDFKLLYFLYYFYLILRYPFSFIKKLPSLFQKYFGMREYNDWHDLSFFLTNK